MPESGGILVSSAGNKIPLIESVQAAAAARVPPRLVVAGDTSGAALSQYVADQFWLMPRLEAATFEALLAGCQERRISCVIPTRDAELPFWAAQRDRFAHHGVQVVVSSPPMVALALDKLEFSAVMAGGTFRVIPSATVAEGDGPFVVKERFGAGSRSIGLRLSKEAAIAHAMRLSDPIFQPFVDGREISIDAWCNRDGEVSGVVLRVRDVVVDGESKVTTTFRDAVIEARVASWLAGRGLRGPVMLQAILDAQGELHVIELNARFGGASTAAIAVGLDVWAWSLAEWDGEGLPVFRRSAHEVRQVRVPSDRHQWRSE